MYIFGRKLDKTFNELNLLSKTLKLNRINKGEGVETALISNNAKWHKSCRLQLNNTKFERAQKRIQNQGKKCLDNQKESSSKLRRSTEASNDQSKCFFCGESAGKEALHQASTFQLDKNVRRAATLIGNMELLGRLSAGDMVALEAKYHAIAY